MNFRNWGVRLAEQRLRMWPADPASSAEPEAMWYRGVTVNAPTCVVFRWLCQIRVAPYSYDFIDNFGRQSPRRLLSGLDQLKIGQSVMTIFRVSDFSADRYLTIHLSSPLGLLCRDLSITYLCLLQGVDQTRLLVRIGVNYPKNLLGPIACLFLSAGDWVMMRKQLLTLKKLAEQSRRQNHL
jgi:hypothetical protein